MDQPQINKFQLTRSKQRTHYIDLKNILCQSSVLFYTGIQLGPKTTSLPFRCHKSWRYPVKYCLIVVINIESLWVAASYEQAGQDSRECSDTSF